MTNTELAKKYPIGTKIKWVLDACLANNIAKKDIGKLGVIVGYNKGDCPLIFLPKSEHLSSNSTQAVPISWWATWNTIEILPQKNEQLLFSFMNAVT